MSASPTLLFLPNAGASVGGGHVLRCLALARALRLRGARCVFATPGPGRRLVERFGGPDIEAVTAEADAWLAIAADLRPAAVIVDHYGVGAEMEAALRAPRRPVLVLDDLADRPHACDLLLDPGYGRGPDAYRDLVPREASLLLGPDYALLRPEFSARRAAAFAPVGQAVARVFVSFGLSDVGGIAARAVDLLRRAAPDVRLDVALASSAESLPPLTRRAADDSRLHLHVDATEVAPLLAEADIAIGAGGSTTWERACLGAPALAVAVAENQRGLLAALGRAGALLACDLSDPDFAARFAAAFTRLQDPGLRARFRETSRALCDGLGAERAVAALWSVLDGQG